MLLVTILLFSTIAWILGLLMWLYNDGYMLFLIGFFIFLFTVIVCATADNIIPDRIQLTKYKLQPLRTLYPYKDGYIEIQEVKENIMEITYIISNKTDEGIQYKIMVEQMPKDKLIIKTNTENSPMYYKYELISPEEWEWLFVKFDKLKEAVFIIPDNFVREGK
jgi:hypothetical protein